jgi:pimeloyl-ACP methyl ester carboxylesterase
MERPHLLLIPNFTELEWVIKPRLEEWAEVLSYDPPGIGDEPLAQEDREAIRAGGPSVRELIARRGLEKVDRRGWDRYFIVADGEGTGAAALAASAKPDAVQGIALGHASLDFGMTGERPAISLAVWEAMAQLVTKDHDAFVRTGIVQVTGENYREELAQRMMERFDPEVGEALWDALGNEPIKIGQLVAGVGAPLLLAKHDGCLIFTDEGFKDAAAAFPDARAFTLPEPPCLSEAFAGALRSFCSEFAGSDSDD